MNASYEMRFSHGIFMTPPLLGYDQNEEGNLIINEEEAKTVRLIFFMYLYGYSTRQIADLLTKLERPTKRGNVTWSRSSVLSVCRTKGIAEEGVWRVRRLLQIILIIRCAEIAVTVISTGSLTTMKPLSRPKTLLRYKGK